jgi:hypothetical protein
MKLIRSLIPLAALAAALAFAPALATPATASASSHCRGAMDIPGYDNQTTYDDVQVASYRGMTCARALRIGAAAYSRHY